MFGLACGETCEGCPHPQNFPAANTDPLFHTQAQPATHCYTQRAQQQRGERQDIGHARSVGSAGTHTQRECREAGMQGQPRWHTQQGDAHTHTLGVQAHQRRARSQGAHKGDTGGQHAQRSTAGSAQGRRGAAGAHRRAAPHSRPNQQSTSVGTQCTHSAQCTARRARTREGNLGGTLRVRLSLLRIRNEPRWAQRKERAPKDPPLFEPRWLTSQQPPGSLCTSEPR